MKEKSYAYTQRMLGYVEGLHPLDVLPATADKLDRLITDIPVTELRRRPAPERRSVNEILVHLADANR